MEFSLAARIYLYCGISPPPPLNAADACVVVTGLDIAGQTDRTGPNSAAYHSKTRNSLVNLICILSSTASTQLRLILESTLPSSPPAVWVVG